jgi:hypothetical protein
LAFEVRFAVSGNRHRLVGGDHYGCYLGSGRLGKGTTTTTMTTLEAQADGEAGGRDGIYWDATGRACFVSGCRELLQEPGSARKGRGASVERQGPGHI